MIVENEANYQNRSVNIPEWCGLNPEKHPNSMGGCKGIYDGRVFRQGEDFCKKCVFYEPSLPFPLRIPTEKLRKM